jgi:hypothetical protein
MFKGEETWPLPPISGNTWTSSLPTRRLSARSTTWKGADKIKLAKSGSPDEKHHFIPLAWVDHVDQHVHLNKSGAEATSQWQ